MTEGMDRLTDQARLRQANLSAVLCTLRDQGAQSRAQLAGATGLNKATVSSLVAELEKRMLVHTAGALPGGTGRPGRAVELTPDSVAGIGLEIDTDHAAVGAVDLGGRLMVHRRHAGDLAGLGYDAAMDLLAGLAEEALSTLRSRRTWVAGLTVAVPGLVESGAGTVQFAPNLGWRQRAIADGMAARLGLDVRHILVDNDANLAALDEYAARRREAPGDLLYLAGSTGIGAGIITAGRLLRGTRGFTGEVGHVPVDSLGPYCACGRRGCWETKVGLGALLQAAADPHDPVRDPELDLEGRLATLRSRAVERDARTLGALQQVGSALGIGASILVNMLNPAAVVLGGYFAVLGEWLIEPARNELAARAVATDIGGSQLVLSERGFTSVVRGGAQAALQFVVDDPTLVPGERAAAKEETA